MPPSNSRNSTPPPPSASIKPEHVDQLTMMLANLMFLNRTDEAVHKLHQMGDNVIRPDDLPESLTYHRHILESIYACAAENVPPAPGAVISRVSARYGIAMDKVTLAVEEILTRRTSDSITVGMMAYGLRREWLDVYRIQTALAQAYNHMSDQVGTANDRVRDSMAAVIKAIPNSQYAITLSPSQALELWETYYATLQARVAAGHAPGPTFPWKGMSKFITSLTKTNLHSIAAKYGAGKTTLFSVLSEHWGWKQPYYVLAIRTETGVDDYSNRRIARYGYLPTHLIKRGVVLPPVWADKIVQAKATIRELEKTAVGRVVDVFWPELSHVDLDILIMQHKGIAETLGLELVVMVDYLQSMNWKLMAEEKTPGVNALARWIKDAAARHRVYMVLMVQEDPAGKGNVEARGRARDGREVEVASQLYISIMRELAKNNIAFTDLHSGQTLRDPFGQDILMERQGDWAAESNIWILKANDDQKRATVPILFHNPYFDVVSSTKAKA